MSKTFRKNFQRPEFKTNLYRVYRYIENGSYETFYSLIPAVKPLYT